jgi:hypothetical protein
MVHVLALPFGLLPPLVDISHPMGQLLEVRSSRISGLARILELTLQKGDPPSEIAGLLANKDQRGGALCLHLQHPFSASISLI